MRTTAIVALFLGVLDLGALGCGSTSSPVGSLGGVVSGSTAATTTGGVTCSYGASTYHPGDTFRSTDGCNNCGCTSDGQVVCTLVACVGSTTGTTGMASATGATGATGTSGTNRTTGSGNQTSTGRSTGGTLIEAGMDSSPEGSAGGTTGSSGTTGTPCAPLSDAPKTYPVATNWCCLPVGANDGDDSLSSSYPWYHVFGQCSGYDIGAVYGIDHVEWYIYSEATGELVAERNYANNRENCWGPTLDTLPTRPFPFIGFKPDCTEQLFSSCAAVSCPKADAAPDAVGIADADAARE